MHMQESCHLVALNNRLAKDFPSLYTAIDPKHDHTLYNVLITETKSLFIHLP
jgi:hypothetical protein